MGMPVGFGAITYTRSTILEDCIKDVGEPFQSPLAKNASGFANPTIEKEPGASTSTSRSAMSTTAICRDSWVSHLKKETPHEGLKYSYVAIRGGIEYRTDMKDKLNQTTDDFDIASFDGEPDTPIQNPYTMQQLGSFGLNLKRIILPPIKHGSYIVLDLCTPTGSIEHWVVPQTLRELEHRDVRNSGWGDLWALGAKARINRNVKIREGSRKTRSKFVTIKHLYGSGGKWDRGDARRND
ncbi:hypothetical protein HOY80DRAFT_1062453 [Tuber brumale]|nr:hypothetical protein HOY80DRAFT_1062453 [Tuber brumale]